MNDIEKELLTLLKTDISSKEICEKLKISSNELKIYLESIKEKEKSNSKEGIWKKYTKDNITELSKSIKNKNTNWCLVNETTAKSFAKYGPIYVYYTKDEKEGYTNPRLCILNNNQNNQKVLGILPHEQPELELIEALKEKIMTLKNQKQFLNKLKDLETLKTITEKENKELTTNELKFLYEIEKDIDSFGLGRDLRIDAIKETRNPKKDLAKVFNCSETQVGTNIKELNKDLTVFLGNLDLNKTTNLDNYKIPKVVVGNLILRSLKTTKGLENLSLVVGNLDLSSVKNTKHLTNLMIVTGNLDLRSAENIDEIKNVIVNGDTFLYSLKENKTNNLRCLDR